MLYELEEMSLMFDFLPRAEAERLIREVSRKLAKMLNAHIVDILWVKEARNGIILEPFAWYVDDQCRRGEPKPYQIPNQIREDEKTGLWTYVYATSEAVWIEGIVGADWNRPMINKATDKEIDAKFLYVWGETDSFMATPLLFRDVVQGVFCVELPEPYTLNKDILKLMRRLATPIGTIIWKAEAQSINDKQTKVAIDHYLSLLQNYDLEHLNPYRSGFIARSFDNESAILEACIKKEMAKHGIKAEQVIPEPARSDVITAMRRQIKSAHFGIVDITGNNPNVMFELGMMGILGKKLLLLRHKGDQTEIPFDISIEHRYSYNVKQDSNQELVVEIWSAGQGEPTTIEKVVESFIRDLYRDQQFRNASPWDSQG
jgi:GAF domain